MRHLVASIFKISHPSDLSSSLPQGQADLLKHAKAEVEENMKQVHDAALTGNLSKEGGGLRRIRSQTGRGPDDDTSAWDASPQRPDHTAAIFAVMNFSHTTSLFSRSPKPFWERHSI